MIRRVARFAVAGCCLLSLLACMGTGWLWWLSYRKPYDWIRRTDDATWSRVEWAFLMSDRGFFGVGYSLTVLPVDPWNRYAVIRVSCPHVGAAPLLGRVNVVEAEGTAALEHVIVEYDGTPVQPLRYSERSATIPYWWLTLASAAPPFLLTVRRRRAWGRRRDCSCPGGMMAAMERPQLDYASPDSSRRSNAPRLMIFAAVVIAVAVLAYFLFRLLGF
jgi:hypothetical protein